MNQPLRSFFEDIGLRIRNVSEGKHEYNVYCPFHSEKEASLFINTNKGVFHCFGACGKKGSIRSLFYAMNESKYKDWLYRLSMLADLALTWEENIDTVKKVEKIDVDELPLCDVEMQYLSERQISERTIEKFNLKYHKKFNAIVVPVYERDGGLRGYVRRNMEGTRYMNGPEMDVDTIVFPANHVKTMGVNKVILVEGIFDAIRAHQEGYPNAISCFGNRLTDNQIREIGKLASSVVVVPDKDHQGMEIAEYNIEKLQSYGFAVELILLQGTEKDIAELKVVNRLPITSYYQLLFQKRRLTQLI